MKTVAVLDDLDVAAGQVLPHTQVIRIGWDGVWYELDLNDVHAADLWQGIKPYLDAGRRIRDIHATPALEPVREQAAIAAAEADPSIPRYGRVVLYHAVDVTTRRYWKDFRKWATANGYVIHQHKDNTYYHPVDLVEEYERHLTRLDRENESKAS